MARKLQQHNHEHVARSTLRPGMVFGFLTVMDRPRVPTSRKTGIKNTRYWVKCVCGAEKTVARCQLVSGDTQSCGCKRVKDPTQPAWGPNLAQFHGPVPRLRRQRYPRKCPGCGLRSMLRPMHQRHAQTGAFELVGLFCLKCDRLVHVFDPDTLPPESSCPPPAPLWSSAPLPPKPYAPPLQERLRR